MAEAWVYIDESQSPSAEGVDAGKPFRIGALVVETPIPASIPEQGLATLRGDADAVENKSDQETLRRGYFHASFDSQNAHSALTYAVTRSGLAGAFSDMQWHFGRHDSGKYEEGPLHALMVLLGALTVTQDDYDAVHLVVAKREGTFDENTTKDWNDYWRPRCLGAFAKQPNIPTRFPFMTIALVGGDEPGIQVCDLVLWAVQRARLDKLIASADTTWFKRLGLRARSGGGEVDGATEQVSLTLGKGVDRPFIPALDGGRPRLPEELSNPEVLQFMREVEAEVRRCAALAAGNQRIKHLVPELSNAVESLDGKPGVEEIVKVAEAFLLCCDTLPTYDPSDGKGYVRVAERRRVAAAVADRSNPRWHTMALFWSRAR